MNLQDKHAKRCATADAWALKDNKVLLVKHKWLGIWLAPGGHIEENELPHQAAEREFHEETGLVGRVMSAGPVLQGTTSEYLPLPFAVNLHEINKPRKNSFCEQHYAYSFFLEVTNGDGLSDADEGITDIGWFGEDEIDALETSDDIKKEAHLVFQTFPKQI